MTAEVYKGQRFRVFPVETKHCYLVVRFADGMVDFRVIHPGICFNAAVFHDITADKGDPGCLPVSSGHFCGFQILEDHFGGIGQFITEDTAIVQDLFVFCVRLEKRPGCMGMCDMNKHGSFLQTGAVADLTDEFLHFLISETYHIIPAQHHQ